MRRIRQAVVMLLCCSLFGPLLAISAAARQGEEGKRNTTMALGAVTGYLFTRRGSKVPAFVGLAATGYAYKQYHDAIMARHRRERYAAYHRGFTRGERYAQYHRRARHHRRRR